MNDVVQLEGVFEVPLAVFQDDRGAVLHMVRSNAKFFQGFGEVYFSEVNPGVVKGWKRHLRATQHFSVPSGLMKIVLFDARVDSPTAGKLSVHLIGRLENYSLLIVPPLIWYGFQAVSPAVSLLCNCSTHVHELSEAETLTLESTVVPYNWTSHLV